MTKKIRGTSEAWDERLLGTDARSVATAEPNADRAVDDALGLKLISIRLPGSLIEDFKNIATINGGMGYQTLMRQVLQSFAASELKIIAHDYAEQLQRAKAEEAPAAPATRDRQKKGA
ncbi:hypothetical protein RAE19_09785 [Rhodoferax sp. TBRC 17660]|uniref:BrnA antitoxin of type II toxin-antitoxin system n=1 Tax=Rhodoferax potami TaxID=3068338 RepID=A0ABU3KNS0_9BURK|nr:hypothetical protein [Rhodoferax sp. TBRC 17660]MDT7518998.1 hypothetical protein [Rhodoferax sp. TBRC 17660]